MYLLLLGGGKIEFKYLIFFIEFRAGEFEIPAWIAIVLWFLQALVGMIIDIFSDAHSGTAFGAHVGGLLAGCAMIGVYKLVNRSKKEEEQTAVPVLNPISARFQPAMATARAEPEPQETSAIFITHDGQQTGPFSVSQVQAMVRLGSIGPEAFFWTEGMADWQSIAEFSG